MGYKIQESRTIWKPCYNPLIGLKVSKQTSEEFDVFVQSTGSGARHLPKGSHLLYEVMYCIITVLKVL